MSLLSSIITLGAVIGFGWFTIYYLVPKLEAEMGGGTTAAGSGSNEETDIQKALEETLAGLTGGETTTPEPESDTPVPPEGSEIVPPKEKKKRSKESIEGGSGGRSKKKGKKANTEYRYFNLGEYYY